MRDDSDGIISDILSQDLAGVFQGHVDGTEGFDCSTGNFTCNLNLQSNVAKSVNIVQTIFQKSGEGNIFIQFYSFRKEVPVEIPNSRGILLDSINHNTKNTKQVYQSKIKIIVTEMQLKFFQVLLHSNLMQTSFSTIKSGPVSGSLSRSARQRESRRRRRSVGGAEQENDPELKLQFRPWKLEK